jgi:hypothetical protein
MIHGSRLPVRLLALVLLVAPAPARAFDTGELGQGGSIALEERMPLIAKNPKLKREVDAALARNGKEATDVTCDAAVFTSRWTYLGGERVAPYTCNFGDKWLRIRADVRITDARGRVYEKATVEAMRGARRASETNLRWKWTDEEPGAGD